MLSRREKERGARKQLTIGETHARERVALAFKSRDGPLDHSDAAPLNLPPSSGVAAEQTIGAEDDILAPTQQLDGKLGGFLRPAGDGDRLPAMFPPVVVGTAMCALAVELLEAFELRQFIDDAGRQQHHPRVNALAGLECDGETSLAALRADDANLSQFDRLVAAELVAPDL